MEFTVRQLGLADFNEESKRITTRFLRTVEVPRSLRYHDSRDTSFAFILSSLRATNRLCRR
jgi:hypothetical protein